MINTLSFIKTPHGSRDFDELSFNPVHNGYTYIVASNYSSRQNYEYKLDIYVQNEKIATLAKNPDLETGNSNYGIFDISTLVSPTLGYDTSLVGNFETLDRFKIDEKMSKLVNVTVRERFSLRNTFTHKQVIVVGPDTYTRLFTSAPSVMDNISYVEKDKMLYNNSVYEVLNVSPTAIVIKGNITEDTGSFLEGQSFADNYFYEDTDGVGKVAYVVNNYEPRIREGQRVFIVQDGTPTNPSYNGEWLCKGVEQISPTSWIVKTNTVWQKNTPAEPGSFFNLSYYEPNHDKSTLGTQSYVINGVFNYVEFKDFLQSTYDFNSTINFNKKFLTNAPLNRSIARHVPYSLGMVELDSPNNFEAIELQWYVNGTTLTGTSVDLGVGYWQIRVQTVDVDGDLYVGDIVNISSQNVAEREARIIYMQNITGGPFAGTTLITTDYLLPDASVTGYITLKQRSYFAEKPFFMGPFVTLELELSHWNQETIATYPKVGAYKFNVRAVKKQLVEIISGQFYYTGQPMSETRTVTYEDSCQDWQTKTLVWINPYGVWDSLEFKGRPLENREYSRDFARRSLQSYSSNDFTYSVGDRGDVTFNIQGERVTQTYTGIINRDTATWAYEIFNSPYVYSYENGQMVPINVISESISLADNQRGLVNIPLTFKYANQIFTQK